MPDEPYAWRSARSRTGRISAGGGANPAAQQMQAQEMAMEGRKPVFNQGRMRGYSSVPGAPNVSPELGIAGVPGTQAHANAWRDFFGPLQTPNVAAGGAIGNALIGAGSSVAPVTPTALVIPGAGDIAADETFGGGTSPASVPATVPTTPDAAHAAVVDGHSNWLQQNGYPVPPPTPAPVDPAAGGYTVTTPQQASSIADQYGPGRKPASDWGAPLPPVIASY